MKLHIHTVLPHQELPTSVVPATGPLKERVEAFQRISELFRALREDALSSGFEGAGVRVEVQEP